MNNRLFIGGLDYNATSSDLKLMVESYGFNVADAYVVMNRETMQSKGFGFVTIAGGDTAKAIASMNGQKFMSRIITVGTANPKSVRA